MFQGIFDPSMLLVCLWLTAASGVGQGQNIRNGPPGAAAKKLRTVSTNRVVADSGIGRNMWTRFPNGIGNDESAIVNPRSSSE